MRKRVMVVVAALTAAGGTGSPMAWAWTDETPSSASQCSPVDINDAGVGAENCLVGNARIAFKTQLSGGSTPLSPLLSTPGGAPCLAGAINNAVVGQETIIGACADGNNVPQGVMWAHGATTPTQLQPATTLLGLIRLGVSTTAAAVNDAGVVIGLSTDANGTDAPTYWSGSGVATLLAPPLLGSSANCEPASINNVSSPSVVGNCPGGGGKNNPVLWTTLSSGYQTLPIPSGASYCSARHINAAGQILGECVYGTDRYQAVQWGTGGTGPAVLQTVNGKVAPRTQVAAQNDAGVVAVNYLAVGSQNGFKEPAVWNPASGNTNASAISLPAGAVKGSVGGIGNNGKLVGNFETASGGVHPFHVEPNGVVAVDDGDPAGGSNAGVMALSRGGVNESVTAEDSSQHAHAEAQPIP
ncbi:hypothetical protein [Burkholderia sp. TSV86]|uniref:hypothetical protein n=1 Tax=Burkholderia sp. TSV86 TaxID=1385594 RepID=UPI00075629F5|nr:hypothetical protein [Burkholderia sp. TSV86]KVE36313.1 hypothetical protein WS68_04735 [Burkholderia sp. TSV86]